MGRLKKPDVPVPIPPTPAEAAVRPSAELLQGLNDHQRAFAIAYAECGNASEAARQAGYGAKFAGTTGARLMKNPAVRGAIERLRAEAADGFDISDEAILRGLWNEANREGKGASHAARVSAWNRLTEIKGMTKTPDLGAWGGISTLRIQVAVGNGPMQEVKLTLPEDPPKP